MKMHVALVEDKGFGWLPFFVSKNFDKVSALVDKNNKEKPETRHHSVYIEVEIDERPE